MPERLGRFPLQDRVQELERIYGIFAKEIALELTRVDVGDYKELSAMKTRKAIDRLIQMLNNSAIRWTRQAIPEAYNKARGISETRFAIMGINKSGEFQEKTHEQTIEHEETKTINDLIKANQSIKQNVATYLYLANSAARGLSQFQAFDMRDEELIDDLLGDALRAGKSRGYAMRKVKSYYKERFGDAKFININGRNYEMRKYADLVAKTRLRVVQTEAVINSCNEYENDLVEVSDHGSEFIDICLDYEGNVYSLSGKHPDYPYLPAYPPFHVRCQHHIRPTSEEALKAREGENA